MHRAHLPAPSLNFTIRLLSMRVLSFLVSDTHMPAAAPALGSQQPLQAGTLAALAKVQTTGREGSPLASTPPLPIFQERETAPICGRPPTRHSCIQPDSPPQYVRVASFSTAYAARLRALVARDLHGSQERGR